MISNLLMITENIEPEEDRTDTSDDETPSLLSISPPSFSPLSLSPCPSDVEDTEDSATPTEKPDDSSGSAKSLWCGYRFILDNLDNNISPSFQRMNNPKQSLHHVHGYMQ